jgi:hypothetical protein
MGKAPTSLDGIQMPPSHQPNAPNPVVISGSSAQLPATSVVVVVVNIVDVVPSEVDVVAGTDVVVRDSVVVEASEDVVVPAVDVVVSPASPGLQAAITTATSGTSLRMAAKLASRRGNPKRFEIRTGVGDQPRQQVDG